MSTKPNFRTWVMDLYYQNLAEREAYGIKDRRDYSEYFRKYKWWLKREYQYQNNKTQDN